MDMNETGRETTLDDLVRKILSCEEAAKAYSDMARSYRAELYEGLRDVKRTSVDRNGETFTATAVKTVPIEIDYDKMIEDRVFSKKEIALITERKFSRKLLEEQIENGSIAGDRITDYLKFGKERTSVRIAKAKGSEPEGEDEQC